MALIRPAGWTALAAASIAVLLLGGCGGDRTTQTVVVTETVSDVAVEPPETSEGNDLPEGRFRFEGSGTQLLRPIDVPADTTLHWTATGGLFMLIVMNDRADIGNPQLVVSQAPTGETFLPAGYYEFKVSVYSDGEWAISIE